MSPEQEEISLTTATSTSLLEGLERADNRTVWEKFVGRYRPAIFKWACQLGLRDDEADDAAQETLHAFAKAYSEGRYERDKGGLRSWLFGIAHNCIKNALRQRPEHVQIVDPLDKTGFFEREPDPDPDHLKETWEKEWQQTVLRQCLEEIRQTLAPKTVEAFELFAWKGWTAERVAEHLGMSENAVYLAKFKILKRIQALLPRMTEIW